MVRSAFGRAWRVWRRELGAWLELTMVALGVYGMAFAPALTLLSAHAPWMALLCVPLFVALVLPMRERMARLMREALQGRGVQPLLLCQGSFRREIARGLRVSACLLLCASPALGLAAWLVMQYKGTQDAFSVMRMFTGWGSGDLYQGALLLLPAALATLLPLLAGRAFCAGSRHAAAQSHPKLLRGHRGGVALCWLCAQVTLLPALVGTALVCWRFIHQAMTMLAARDLDALLQSVPGLILPLCAVWVALLAPLLSLRSLIVAAYVQEIAEAKA